MQFRIHAKIYIVYNYVKVRSMRHHIGDSMAQLQGKERAAYVQDMFDRIAKRYNFMNRIMTFGQDMRWRRFVVKQAQMPQNGKMLDLATGTGDIAFEAAKQYPQAQVIGADFALEMMRVGKQTSQGNSISWTGADALALPYANELFDAVVSGYLVRNVIDIPKSLQEQMRVLKAGGRIVILDTSPPPNNILKPFILMHLKYGIPLLGRLIAGDEGKDAYQYLPESTQAFKTPDELATIMRDVGLVSVGYKTFMFGTMAVHWGEKAS
jgi:demethylmenaquinone methyltransferase/2-methoxy-6-polyprenyl-1,4-benzoquinol methylase